ncbi:hypothetical protein BGZ94_002189 [Podila epigama]|nr:hypothetical protein BGZ94_002189 [Podila epigama]
MSSTISTNVTPKAQTVVDEFLAARAKANYSAFDELARRYLKHNKDGNVFVNTALLEKAIAEADLESRKAHKWGPTASLNDTPEDMSISPRFDPEAIRAQVEALEGSLSQGSEEHQEQAAFILARGALRTAAPDRIQRVAHYLQNVQLPPTRVPTGYNLALVVSALIIKGLATEESGDVAGGVALYDNAIDLVLSSPNERSDELANWTEHALYRGGLLKLRLGDQLATIRIFRHYHNLGSSWPTNFRLPRRITIYNHYARTLAAVYKTNAAAGHDSASTDDQFSLASLALELTQVHSYWENALYTFTPFPKANEVNWRVIELIERVVEDRNLIGAGTDADKKSLVEAIFRASQKTFQSPRILRLLLLAQIDAGLYAEADVTLQAYWNAIETQDKVKKNNDEKQLTFAQRLRQDVESDDEIATALIAGARLYANHLNKSGQANVFADRAVERLERLPVDENTKRSLHEAHKYQAAALGLAAAEGREI